VCVWWLVCKRAAGGGGIGRIGQASKDRGVSGQDKQGIQDRIGLPGLNACVPYEGKRRPCVRRGSFSESSPNLIPTRSICVLPI
jgi:hypothetical protein